MAYFPNGTAGDLYYAEYCERCVHQDGRHGELGCPIWTAHVQYNYSKDESIETILNMLIPPDEALVAKQCRFFQESRKSWAVGDLFEEESAA